MTRTDIHRPSALEFDPEDYTVAGFADFTPREGYVAPPQATVTASWTRATPSRCVPHGSGQCSHCGTRLRYAALIAHDPTKTLIYVGETCLGNRFEALPRPSSTQLRKASLPRPRAPPPGQGPRVLQPSTPTWST